MPKVIRYKSNSDNIREMTVINGQPYYKSTGHNSGEKDVWFPFLMVIGSQFFEIPKEFKKKRYLINAAREDGTGWIMKYQAKLLPHPKIENVCNGRLPTKECIVISIQLGSVNESFLLSHLSWKEYQKALRKEIQLEDTKQVIENPDEVNQWLIEQGAEFLKKSLTKEPIEILDTVKDCLWLQSRHKYYVIPFKFFESYDLLLQRLMNSTYGSKELKYKKNRALLQLLDEIHEGLKKDRSKIQPFDLEKIIEVWKNEKVMVEEKEITNYELISKHRRTGIGGFFNIGKTNSQQFIDNLLTSIVIPKLGSNSPQKNVQEEPDVQDSDNYYS